MAEYKEQGNQAYQAADYSKAIQFYSMGIDQEPDNAALYSNRSAAFLKMEEYFKAKIDAEKCISLDPKWSKGWWRKGTAEFEDQDYRAARSTFNEGLKHCPGDENLVAGVAKATQYLKAMEDLQGPGHAAKGFDLDGPSQRNQENNSQENEKKDDSDESGEKKWPGTASEEIERIKSAPNHYAILHVSTDASNADMKKNYYTLARMLHPDKCQLEGADDAMTTVSTAYDTLTNMIKKTLYDQFLSQTGDGSDKPNQTYQEWESAQEPVQLPSWLNFLLGIKGCGWIIAIMIVILMTPIILLLLLLFLVFFIISLPYRIIMRCCFPEKYAKMKEQQEKELAKLEEQQQDRIYAHV